MCSKREILEEMGYGESVVFESPDFDDAIIGVTDEGNVAYDYEAMVEQLMKRDGMERDAAVEFIEFNTIRAIPYAPDPKPIVIHPLWE